MRITLPIPEFTRNERNFHCDVLHITTDIVATLVLDDAIAAIQTSRLRPIVTSAVFTVIPMVQSALLVSNASVSQPGLIKTDHDSLLYFKVQNSGEQSVVTLVKMSPPHFRRQIIRKMYLVLLYFIMYYSTS